MEEETALPANRCHAARETKQDQIRKSNRDRREIFKKSNRRDSKDGIGGAAAMPFPMGTRMKPRGGLVFRLSSIVITVAGNKGTFVPISTVDDRNWWARRFCFYMANA
ncbi:hypothetical protein ACI2S5_24050 [Ralstonia nicotianae]|uniref:hypothetical protein n=1 Tax=Ralstonia pseudosolanacearum TaxID=1310165 RepID=UPI001181B82F|nr:MULTISPECIES: hypothetical protein [Ralstonia]QKL53663.1 hypothetical protein HI816_19335 [Ralstonia solanacearum]MDC6292702.1 hypothetical protein [Ralstonia pseudosolanacearum]MDD7787772.1 hypothetical protein [Ralstonia pseudosolanacearum]MDO3516838.1 hypothetical protein [Ralstonia pseudosolanacearum]MDO3543530.1 hypothetical protein [Ralstonia pseudosolanacearum]